MASLAELLQDLQEAYTAASDYVVNAKLGSKPTPIPAGRPLQGAPVASPTGPKVITGSGSPLNGTSKADYIVGATTAQQINGLAGNDTINGGGGNDSMDGGTGVDLVSFAPYGASNPYAAGVIADLAAGTYSVNGAGGGTIINFENIEGSVGSDWLQGNALDNMLLGGLGNDSLLGLAGKDKLYGGDGNDSLDGGDGDDFLDGGVGNDALFGGSGKNQLIGGSGDDGLMGGVNDDELSGGDGNDYLSGGLGNNKMTGGTGRDVAYLYTPGILNTSTNSVDTGDDNDLIFLAGGKNKIKAGAGEDFIFAYSYSGNSNDVASAAAMTNSIDAGSGEDLVLVGAGRAEIKGGAGEDFIAAGFAYNSDNGFKVDGGDDNDWILTGDGDDYVSGGAGNDYIAGEDGANRLLGGSGNDYILGGEDSDLIRGNQGDDSLYGSLGSDTLIGGSGNDSIDAGYDSAFDSISGGDGVQDLIVFGGELDYQCGGDFDYNGLVSNTDNGVDSIYNLDRCTDDVALNGDILDVSIAFAGNAAVTDATLGSYVWVQAIDDTNSELFVDPTGGGPEGGAGILWARLNGIAGGDEVTIKANDLTTECVMSAALPPEVLQYTVGYYSGGTGGLPGIWLDGSGGSAGVYDPTFDTLLTDGNGLTSGGSGYTIDDADFANNEVTVEWQIVVFPTLDVTGFNEDDKVVINLAVNDTTWGGAATILGFSASNHPPTKVGSFAGFTSTSATKNFRALSADVAYTFPTGPNYGDVAVHLRARAALSTSRAKLLAVGAATGAIDYYTDLGAPAGSLPISATATTPLAVGFNPATLTASQFSFIVPNYGWVDR